MGETSWFGQAIFGCTGEGNLNRIFQLAFVAHRDKNRLDIGACSDHRTDDLLLVLQQAIGAFFEWRFVEGAG